KTLVGSGDGRMMRQIKLARSRNFWAWMVLLLAWASQTGAQYAMITTFDHPLGVNDSEANGVSGNTVVGQFADAQDITHGYIYDGANFTTLNAPLGQTATLAFGVFANVIVGEQDDSINHVHGFRYGGTTYTTIDHPLAASGANTGTRAQGVSATGVVVGYYYTGNGVPHGFSYDGATYTTLHAP